jgi:hypothetical protein
LVSRLLLPSSRRIQPRRLPRPQLSFIVAIRNKASLILALFIRSTV